MSATEALAETSSNDEAAASVPWLTLSTSIVVFGVALGVVCHVWIHTSRSTSSLDLVDSKGRRRVRIGVNRDMGLLQLVGADRSLRLSFDQAPDLTMLELDPDETDARLVRVTNNALEMRADNRKSAVVLTSLADGSGCEVIHGLAGTSMKAWPDFVDVRVGNRHHHVDVDLSTDVGTFTLVGKASKLGAFSVMLAEARSWSLISPGDWQSSPLSQTRMDVYVGDEGAITVDGRHL